MLVSSLGAELHARLRLNADCVWEQNDAGQLLRLDMLHGLLSGDDVLVIANLHVGCLHRVLRYERFVSAMPFLAAGAVV